MEQLENEVEPKDRFNCQRPPLLEGNALMIYSLPTFHLFQGITQTLYNRAVEPLSQETIHDVNQCLVRLKVRKSVYHGHAFEGNEARKLLHSLEDEEFRMLLGYTTHYTALRYFAKLVTAAFGIERTDNWEETLEDFTVSLGQCKGYNLTPKQHAVVLHLKDYINEIISPLFDTEYKIAGCAVTSEQALDSSHHLWNVIWDRYKHIGKQSEEAMRSCILEFHVCRGFCS